jgi:hypothetical protein
MSLAVKLAEGIINLGKVPVAVIETTMTPEGTRPKE